MKVTYTINNISIIYEGSVEEFLKLGVPLVKGEMSNSLPEYLNGIDLSVIPEDWDEVWIAQDANGDVVTFSKKPVISHGDRWWNRNVNGQYIYLVDVGYCGDCTIPGWEQSVFKYR